MSMLVWVMMGIALWHFTIFLPDRFWGGIVGAFIAAIIGAVLLCLIIHGFSIPGRHRGGGATAAGCRARATAPRARGRSRARGRGGRAGHGGADERRGRF